MPTTIDLEGGYATDHGDLRENIQKVIAAGAVAINFEDRIIESEGLYSIEDQSARIEAIREAAEKVSILLFGVLGVARICWGAGSCRQMSVALEIAARAAFSELS